MEASERRVLHLVTDPRLPRPHLLDAVRAASDNGLDWVQVRDHRATARELLDLTRDVLAICRPRGVRVAVNDRIDVALAAGADGIQLGEHGLPAEIARRLAPRLRLGVSVHDLRAAQQAAAAGADWVTFGHIFATPSHPGEPPRGLEPLAEVVRAVGVPVVAIGGITADNVGAVLGAGARGVAVISAILDAPDPGAVTRALRRLLDSCGAPPGAD
ncbi:MAG TPA: thiamine phosphate synthase [Chloroflexota bacterium]|nr:thiamine phosphate synthase [Chloroflexota bacterium]